MDNTTLFLDSLKGLAQRGKKFYIPYVANGEKESFPQKLLNLGSQEHKNAGQVI